MTMDLADIGAALARVTYKPGWSLSVYKTPAQGLFLNVHLTDHDAYKPDQSMRLNVRSQIPPMGSEDEFYRWLRWRLEVIEVHECHEWLRWTDTGKALFDPHAPEAVLPEPVSPGGA